MTNNTEYRILGRHKELLSLETRNENRSVVAALTSQARSTLEILSPDLENDIYDNPEFVAAVSQLARRSRHSSVRILIRDSAPVVKNGHRLVELAYRLSSSIKIRKTGHPYRELNEALIIADETGYLHRKAAHRYEAVASFADRREARRLMEWFNDVWEKSTPDPDLRRLHL